MRILCFVFVILLYCGSASSATRLFYENFDDQSGNDTGLSCRGGNGCPEYNPSNCDNGGPFTYVADNYDGGAGYAFNMEYGYSGCTGGGLTLEISKAGMESTTGEHYVSYWFQKTSIDTSHIVGGASKIGRSTDDTSSSWGDMHQQWVMIYNAGGYYTFYLDRYWPALVVDNLPFSGFQLADTDWHHMEIYYKYDDPVGSGNGEMTLTMDGTQRNSDTTIHLNCGPGTDTVCPASPLELIPTYNKFYFAHNLVTGTPNGDWRIDELEVWDGMPDEIFLEDWSDGTKDAWDDSSANLVVSSERLQRTHLSGTTSTGSTDKGFGDNGVSGFQTLTSERLNDVTLEADVEFSTASWASDGTTKVMILESWPGTSYPSTANKDFQSLVEVDTTGQFVVTIKREEWDFYTRYQTSPGTISADTVYNVKLRVKLDSPYTSSNGELQFWVDDVLKIDNSDEDFILTSRGSDLPRGLNMLMLTGYTGGSGSPDNKVQYWDNIVLSAPSSASDSKFEQVGVTGFTQTGTTTWEQ